MILHLKRFSPDKVGSYPIIKFTLVVFIFSILISMIFGLISDFIGLKDILLSDKPGIKGRNIYFHGIILVIVIPLIETLIFQSIPYFILTQFDYLKKRSWVIITLPAFLFGLSHYYSLLYILHTTCLGAIFMYAYILRRKKNDSFTAVSLIHLLRNLTAFIVESWPL
jgi:hypothetical protein